MRSLNFMHRPPAVLPVCHGTAEALATVAHFHALDGPDADGLRRVWRLLIGPVADADELFELLRDDLERLWSLINDDWDEPDLDDLTEADFPRFDFPTRQQELEHRLGATIERLSSEVEGFVVRKRRELADDSRITAADTALLQVTA